MLKLAVLTLIVQTKTPHTVTINTTPVADAPADVTACDGYVLPALTVGNYFSTTCDRVGPIPVGTNIT